VDPPPRIDSAFGANVDFNLARFPSAVRAKRTMTSQGDPWEKVPPGFVTDQDVGR